MTYCCKMREKFLVSIVGTRMDIPDPVDLIDFMVDFENPTITIKFCPFCGEKIIYGKDPTVSTKLEPEDEDDDIGPPLDQRY